MSIAAAIPLIGKVLDRVFPDPEKANEAKLRVLELTQQGELAELDADVRLALGQMEINKEEAKSPHWFVAGWRPFVGWVCGLALFWNFMMYPTVVWFGVTAPPLDVAQLMIVLGGMLGLGTMRSWDKSKNVDTHSIS